ncbi:CoA transferase [Nocardiopsis sp. HNM0947]|uniref:CoA transferase n=1 Tax=Nocardiopsis coralli TaxID=2772213 RepID=A0ABR9PCG3_9ACTN|nr:CaiB/BaiF CoA-transferase family protein [Nocardiopsis coralli]MBE3001537.1 CoA transferase [Nocardiopsis coralli]
MSAARETAGDPGLPLEGFTVVSLEQAVAAPLATRHLADLGARVIKVERPGSGDFARGYDRSVQGESSYFVWLNRGKESVELDIKDAGDRALLDRIVAGADVFVHNLVPGAVDRLGLDAATVRARHPRLVHCSVSGYGPDGPYGRKKAYDLLIQCESGLVSTTGTPEEVAKSGISIADIATGMYAYSGILTALLRRERTGRGAALDVAMLDALGEWMTQPAYRAVHGGREVPRTGARHASIAPYGPYRVGDGGTVFLGVQNDREWAALCREVLGRPELVGDPRFVHNTERVEHDAEITSAVEASFAGGTVEGVEALLEGAGIANARVRSPREFADHPQLLARGRWDTVGLPGGTRVGALVPPVGWGDLRYSLGDVPALGAHTAAVRAEFGGGDRNGTGRTGGRHGSQEVRS